jgi:hypothetical protein
MNAPPRFCQHCGAALDLGDRFCAGCGQPTDGTWTASVPMNSTPMAAESGGAPPGRPLPWWLWLLGGLISAGAVAGGLYWLVASPAPARPPLTAAQEAQMQKRVLDDLPERDAIDVQQAISRAEPSVAPQRTSEGSALSAEHEASRQKPPVALPKVGAGVELVDTTRAPSFTNDFSNPASGWRVATNDKATREYINGTLRIVFRAPRGSAQIMAGRPAGNFAMQIDATPVSSPPNFYYGVVVRQSDADTFIVFLISPQGMYAISTRAHGKNTAVVSRAASAAIRPGMTTNVIRVYAVDSHFVFEVNGQLVDVAEIDGFASGDVGVIVVRSPNAEPDPTRVTFDNFKLWVSGGH